MSSVSGEDKPLPRITPDSRPFWDGCAAGELRVQRCAACAGVQFPPRARCVHCGAGALAWHAMPPRATVYSFTVVHRAPSAAFRADAPYAIALAELAPGARLLVNVTGCAPADVAIGMALDIGFEERRADGASVHVPVARPAAA